MITREVYPDISWVHPNPCGAHLIMAEGELSFKELISRFSNIIMKFYSKGSESLNICHHDLSKVVFEAFFEAYKNSFSVNHFNSLYLVKGCSNENVI